MDYKNITIQQKENFQILTINRPEFLNAINIETISELSHAIDCFLSSKNSKCLVITGSDKKAFVAGADVKEFSGYNAEQGKELSITGQKNLFDKIENSSKPIIAAINGYALGGGLELAMSCHIRIAVKSAKMGLPEVSLGVIPGYGGTQRLSQLIGKGRAIDMVITAKMIPSEKAYTYGLINYICEEEELLSVAEKVVGEIIKNSLSAISSAIKVINQGSLDRSKGYEMEKKMFGECFETKDFIEGTGAFLEKRKPKFT
ncbi:MAG: enoyl-CoA hydratase [Flavobacteriales bacterium]|nr:enoyl-CoA hydratase [Flavobacteriales bacterium]|tara:strand:- start:2561 stop:3337 length:777 start_codon:yes stop_codon:yes gene_type:complete